ncbi:MAG: hypothetical protein SchgKO_20040 [Schleiferiaceae bacterium]
MKLTNLFALALVAGFAFTSCEDDGPSDAPATTPDTTFETEELKDDDGNVVETIVTINDFGKGTGTTTLTADKTWVLEGLVFVNEGQVLTIDPGTVIKGKSGQGENASGLVVARGAKVMAEGTAAMPIIMTSESDQTRRNADGDLENGGNLPANVSGLWGGLIVLGNADITAATETRAIEGIPTSETRGLYGGSDDSDNSGVYQYISIRHGGTDIGAGNEINGFTLGAVGNGTTIDHIEIIANADDGIEFFGGNARVKNLLVAYCGDDAIDYDEGYKGFVQYALVFEPGDRGGEHDGGPSDCEDCMPYATPVFGNVTSIGKGGSRAVTFRDNAGGQYHNSIMYNYAKGIDIEDLAAGEDSRARLEAGDLKWMNNIHWDLAGNDATMQVITGGDNADVDLLGHANVQGNQVVNPMLVKGVATATEAQTGTWPSDLDAWFDTPNYKGAFDPNGGSTWIAGWTLTDEADIL